MVDRAAAWTAGFSGVIAATLTPFDARGVDAGAVAGYVEFLLDGGADGLMVAGTTGEFVTLEAHARRVAVEAFVSAVAGRVPVIAHVGHVDREVSMRLAEHAAGVGADAVAGITPYYYPASPAAIEQHLRAVARRVPELPFLVYDFPRATGNRIPFAVFERLLDEPNVAGTKLSVATFDELEPYLALSSDVCVVSGNDSLLPAFVASGGQAVVSGNAAAFPEVIAAAFADASWADRRGAVQDALNEVSELTRGGAPDRLKALLRRRGLDLGPARVRTHTDTDLSDSDDELFERVLTFPTRTVGGV